MESVNKHRAKKSLGQNFLNSPSILNILVKAGKLTPSDTILEIGPGKGALTKQLLFSGARVVAVEKDRDLVPILREKFKEELASGQLRLHEGDILTTDLKKIGLSKGNYIIIANIPYYITGILLRHFLEHPVQPKRMVLLVQKEVAERIVARDNKESILSLSVKYFGIPTYIKTVPKRYFSPAPKVDSGVICIDEISQKRKKEAGLFFTIIKTAFHHKRKTLVHNLSEIYPRERIVDILATLEKDSRSRAEDLSYTDWTRFISLLVENNTTKHKK